jgi:integrase
MTEKRVTVWVQRFKDRPALVLQWIDPGTGKRKSKSAGTDDAKEAEQRRADLEYELNHGRHQEAHRMSWERFRELFEAEHVAGLRRKTRDKYENALNLFEEVCRPQRLSAVNERVLSQFVAGLRARACRGGRQGLAPSSIAAVLRYVRHSLRWAAGQRLLPECPKVPTVRVPWKAPQPVPPEAVERLLAAADDQLRAFLLCGWLAGLRLEEAYLLEWEQADKAPWVDLAGERIVLPAEMVKAARDQEVPLDRQLRAALLALPQRGRRVFHFGPNRGAKAITDRVCRLARKAGVRLTMRALRRGFACRYAAKVPAQVLQRLMRHRDIKTTMLFYANVDEAAREAVLGPKTREALPWLSDEGREGPADVTPDVTGPAPGEDVRP